MKKIGSIIINCGVLVLCFFPSSNVFAENIPGLSGVSEATLSLDKGMNDNAPDIIIDTNQTEGITSQTGDLTIDYLPNFNFVFKKMMNNIGYYEQVVSEKQASFVQVSDRSGTGNGWQLNLTVNPFKTDKGEMLKNGELIFHDIIMEEKETNISESPLFTEMIVYQLSEEPATKTLVNAKRTEGLASWALLFENNNKGLVTMSVPIKGVKTGHYASALLWELVAGPTE